MAQTTLSERLLAEFSSKLDSALILAIAADAKDDNDHQDQKEADARATLQALADATTEDTYSAPYNSALQDSLSDSTATLDTASTLTSTTTDDEAIERAFQEWSIEESQLDDDKEGHKDLNAIYTDSDASHTASLDPISFLKSLFPKRQHIELQVAYSDAEDDIQTTIETLLTEDLLICEEEDYILGLQQEESNESNGRSDKVRRRRKLGKQTISLTSTPRGVGIQREAPIAFASEPEKSNVWIKTDSTILYLSQLLSVPPGTLSSLFYSNNNSLPLAVSKILDQAEIYHEAIPEEEKKLARIRELFPNSPIEPLRRCLYATEGDIPKTVELYKVLEDIHVRDGTPLAHGLLLQKVSHKPKPTALAAAPGAQHLAQQSPATLHRTRSDRPPTAQECLLIANAIRARRDDAYRSAARSWRGKAALGNSGVAAYWADHARQLDREARQWELTAARETVEERRKAARSALSIDLHGLTASQALTVTNESLNSWWHNPSAPASLTIVTGAGKHSAGQAPVLLPIIRKLLEREGYDWKYEGDRHSRGSFIVTGLQGRRKTPGGW